MSEMRKDRRAPVSLKVKYKSATVDEFIEQFGIDISNGGIFIKTKKPLDTAALLKFEFQLQDGSPVIHGVGRVAWRRSEHNAKPDAPAGMGIKFIKLDDGSRAVVDRIAAGHGAKGSRFEKTAGAELAPPMNSAPPPASDSVPPPRPSDAPPPNRPTSTLPRVAGPAPRTSVPAIPAQPLAPRTSAAPQVARPTTATPAVKPAAPLTASGLFGSGGGSAPRFAPPAPEASSGLSRASVFDEAPTERVSRPGSGPALPRPPASPATSKAPNPAFKLPKGMASSFFGEEPKPAASAKAARDTSEFLASAFSAGGAGQEVRAEARAQAERARRDQGPADLADELFGDMPSQATASSDLMPLGDPEDLAGLPKAHEAKSPSLKVPSMAEVALGEQIPSMQELADEPAHAPQVAAAAGGLGAADDNDEDDEDDTSLFGEAERGGASVPSAQLAAAAAAAPAAAQKSRAGLIVAIVLLLAAVGGGGFFMMQRSAPPAIAPEPGAAEPVAPAQAAEPPENPAPAAEPSAPPPAAAAEPAAAPAAPAAPAPAAAPAVTAGPPVEVNITSWPRAGEVVIEGRVEGTTPATLSLPSTKPVEISVRMAGYSTLAKSIVPVAHMDPVRFKLEPLPYVLVVNTTPPGATITLGSKSVVAPAPLELGHLDGMVSVSVELDGYQRMSRVVRLDEFSEHDNVMRAEVALSLSQLPQEKVVSGRARPKPQPKAAAAPSAPVLSVTPAAPKPEAPAPVAKPAEKPVEKPVEKPALPKPAPAEKPAPKPAAALPDNPF